MAGAPLDAIRRVPLFAELSDPELEQVAGLFKQRRFKEGELSLIHISEPTRPY